MFALSTYEEHALEMGADARAVSYIQLADQTGNCCFGVGVDANITTASIHAILSSINRLAQHNSNEWVKKLFNNN